MSALHSNRGKAEVYIDGVKAASVDLYSPSLLVRQVVFTKGGLDPTRTHTIDVRVLGQKHASATDSIVDVDAFVTAHAQ